MKAMARKTIKQSNAHKKWSLREKFHYPKPYGLKDLHEFEASINRSFQTSSVVNGFTSKMLVLQ